MSIRTAFRTLAASAAFVALAGGALAAEPAVVKIGSFTPPKAAFLNDITIPWLRKIEKDSNGTVKFQEFWGGQLIRAPSKQYEGMLNGIQDMTQVLPSYTQALFPDFSILSLPFMFRRVGALEGSLAAWKMYERGMLSGLDKVHVMVVYVNDNSGLHFNREIKSLDEIKGLKIRAAGPEEADVIEALGGVPVSMGTPQIAESMHRGVIEGTLTGWSALTMFRITPLIKTHIELPLGSRSFFMAMNKEVYDKLPGQAKQAIEKNSGLELARRFGAYYQVDGEELRKPHPDRTILDFSDKELDEIAKRFQPFHEQWIKEHEDGAKKYKAMQEILAELRKSS